MYIFSGRFKIMHKLGTFTIGICVSFSVKRNSFLKKPIPI